jgi:hypothetical protein
VSEDTLPGWRGALQSGVGQDRRLCVVSQHSTGGGSHWDGATGHAGLCLCKTRGLSHDGCGLGCCLLPRLINSSCTLLHNEPLNSGFHCPVAAASLPRYDIYTFSRPDHPLALLGYPVVRLLQQRFRRDSLRHVARAAACHVVDDSLDDETRRRLEASDGLDLGLGVSKKWWPL